MASKAGAIRAGRTFVEVFTDLTELKKGLRKATRHLKAFGASVASVGRDMLRTATMMATPLAIGAKVFADFEQQMASVSTMVVDTGAHMDRFREDVRRLSVEFGESTETLSKGLYDILSASVAPSKAISVLNASVKAAKAGMTDTAVAADVITTILNAYGLAAERATDVSDLLFSVVFRGKTTFAELAPTIGMVATTAATANVSLEEMGAALATMTRAGVRTEQAVVALNAIITGFLKPSADAANYARLLGFELSSSTIAAEGLAGVFRRISALPTEAIATLFPNVRALRGVLPALKQMQGFTEDLKIMGDRVGKTEEAFAKMTTTLTYAFNQVRQAVNYVISTIGEGLAPLLKDAKDWIMTMLADIGEWIKDNQELLKTYAKIVVGIGAFGAALLAVGKIAFSVGTIIWTTTKAVGALGAAFNLIAAHPIILVFAAITAGVVLLISAVKRLTDTTAQLESSMNKQLRVRDQERQADVDKLRRLDELHQKGQLNNDEMNEARQLTSELTSTYGNLGVAINDLNKTVGPTADAFERLAKAMAVKRLNDLNQAIKEQTHNIEALQRQLVTATTDKDIERTVKKQKAAYEVYNKLIQERKALLERGTVAVPGPSAVTPAAPTTVAPLVSPVENEKLERIVTSWAEKLHAVRTEMTDTEYEHAVRLIEERYEKERAEAYELGMTRRQLAVSFDAEEWELTRLRIERERELREEEARRQEALMRDLQDRTITIEELQLRARYKGAELEERLLNLRQRTAEEEVHAMADRLRMSREDIEERLAAVAHEYDLRRQILEARYDVEARVEARGAFQREAVLSLQAAGMQDRIANATERSAQILDQLRNDLKGKGLVYAA